MSDPMRELVEALSEHNPTIKHIDGRPRLMLTLSPLETVEVSPSYGPFFTIEGVHMNEHGDVAQHPIGAVYGIALIPALIREYAAIRAQWGAR